MRGELLPLRRRQTFAFFRVVVLAMTAGGDGLLFIAGAWPEETFGCGWNLPTCATTRLAAIVQSCKQEVTVVRFATRGYRGYQSGPDGENLSDHKDYPITLMNLRGLDSEQISFMHSISDFVDPRFVRG